MTSKSKTVTLTPPTFIQNCFYILFFVTPLLLWPFTSEVFEFNKMLFVYAMTVIISAAWIIRTIKNQAFEIARTPLDLPLLLFLTSQLLSTIFSIDRHTSIWGYYSRFHGGLASTLCYLILFYALVTHFKNFPSAITKLFKAIIYTAILTSVYAVLEKLGIDKTVWVQDVQNRVFSTLGQPNWLSAYLIALLPFTLFAFTTAKEKSAKIFYFLTSLLFLISIIFTKSRSGLGATAVILFLFFVIQSLRSTHKNLILGLGFFTLLFLGIFKFNAVKSTFISLNKINPYHSNTIEILHEENKTRIGGSDSMVIRRVVWEGALKLGQKYPFFGTGAETFAYSYYWVRPATHNLTSESDFLYNKAHNEYLNFLATTGVPGLLTYLFLTVSIIALFVRNPKEETSRPLLLGFISILITNFFGFSVVNIALFFFLFPAIFISIIQKNDNLKFKTNINEILGITLVTILTLSFLLGIRKMWLADIAYTKGRSNLEQTEKAISLNPREPIYIAQLGNLQSLVATQIIAPQIKELPATAEAELRTKAQFFLNQYITNAIKNTAKAVEMNPWNINLYKIKARTELTLSPLDPKYNLEAIKTLLKIIELSPTDAVNYYNLGVLYSGLLNQKPTPVENDTNTDYKEAAVKAFNKALELNPGHEPSKARLQELLKPLN